MIDIDNERNYIITMKIFENMESNGIINDMEFDKLNKIFLEKYSPKISKLFVSNTRK